MRYVTNLLTVSEEKNYLIWNSYTLTLISYTSKNFSSIKFSKLMVKLVSSISLSKFCKILNILSFNGLLFCTFVIAFTSEAYSELSQTSKMKLFAKIVNG